MHSFRKAILASVSFVLCLSFMIVGIVEYNVNAGMSSSTFNSNLRKEYSGPLDTIFIGASHTGRCLNMEIINNSLDRDCWAISHANMSFDERLLLLEEEFERHSISLVIMDVSYFQFKKNYDVKTESTYYALQNLTTFKNRVKQFFNSFNPSLSEDVISLLLLDGFNAVKKTILNEQFEDKYGLSHRGTTETTANNIQLAESNIISKYNSETIDFSVDESKIEDFERIISFCKNKNVSIILVNTPFSDEFNWRCENYQQYLDRINELCSNCGCIYLDCNLLFSRYSLFSDVYSFRDEDHLSTRGAAVFSTVFCEIIKKLDAGEDVSDLFYDSYEEMKQDSPYMEYYLAHKEEQ